MHRIQEELMNKGVIECEKRMIRILKEVCPESSATNLVQCFDDVLDANLFKDDPHKVLNLLHLAQIGSFKSPNDGWARSAALKWMKEKKIRHSSPNREKKEREKKGFSLRLILSKSSDLAQKRLKSLCEHKLGFHMRGKTLLSIPLHEVKGSYALARA